MSVRNESVKLNTIAWIRAIDFDIFCFKLSVTRFTTSYAIAIGEFAKNNYFKLNRKHNLSN